MSMSSCDLHEAHFSGLLGQSNVYGLSNVILPDGTTKVLVSPLKEKVLCLEYLREKGNLKPISREVQFAYIPDDAEIVSMDAFSKLGEGGGLVVGVTVAKDTGTSKHYFNVYCPWEKDSAYNLESVAQGWSTMELDFIPYYLTHIQILFGDEWETVFLLSGSDKKVHLYKEEREIPITKFMEHRAEKTLPEFEGLPSIALWMDIKHNGQHERITAVGCQNGFLRISVVSLKSNEVTQKWELRHDGPITCVRLFQSQSHSNAPPFAKLQQAYGVRDVEDKNTKDAYHLLVTSALEIAVVYRHASKDGFQNQEVLPESDLYDCALCACIADIDWDGHNEILIGTYGQEVLAYKYHASSTKQPTPASETSEDRANQDTQPISDGKPSPHMGGEYRLHWKRSFSQPILAMQYIDITGDGLSELVVVTVRGIHVLQHCLQQAATRCLECLKSITKQDEDKEKLLKEKPSDSRLEVNPEEKTAKETDEGKTIVTSEVARTTSMTSSHQSPDDVSTAKTEAPVAQKKTVATLKEIAEARSASISKLAADRGVMSLEGTEQESRTQSERPASEKDEESR